MLSIMRHEWRVLSADRTLASIAVLMLLTVGYGVINGAKWTQFQRDTLNAARNEESERMLSVKTGIADADTGRTKPSSFADPRTPAAVGRALGVRYASMPPAPLAAFAIGQSDLYPYYFKVSTASQQTFLNNDEIEHPVHLMSGRFDLAFVILYLYPLMILALSYNLISAEKEGGTLALTLSQPVSLQSLALGKIATRFFFALGLAALFSLLAGFAAGVDFFAPDAMPRLLLWFAVVAAYGAFWFALAVGVNALGGSSATNAMSLAGLWLAFVLLIPSLLNVGVKALHPVPSRVEMIQATRTASADAARAGSAILAKYLEDHPELAGPNVNVADAAVAALATQEEVERRVRPVLERFDGQLRMQQELVDRYRFLSPAIVAQSAIFDLAGTGAGRYRYFLERADRFHREWRAYFFPRIARKDKLTADDINTLPRFQFEEEALDTVLGRVSTGLAVLVFTALALGLLALRELRRYPMVG